MDKDEYREYVHLLMKSACYDELIAELKRLQMAYIGMAINWPCGSEDDRFVKMQYLSIARELQALIKAYGHKKSR